MEEKMDKMEQMNDDTTVMHLDGSLTIQEIAVLKTTLQEMLSQTDRLMINCSQASKVDFTLMQLLCSAHRSAVRQGKALFLGGNLPEGLLALIKAAGFNRHCSCPRSDASDNCLWVEAGDDQ